VAFLPVLRLQYAATIGRHRVRRLLAASSVAGRESSTELGGVGLGLLERAYNRRHDFKS
jgi:hypothetical protein